MADYTVQAGDNLNKIAKAHGTTVEKLCELNGIKDANKISVGQKLSLGETSENSNAPQAIAEALTPEQIQEQVAKAEKQTQAAQNVRVVGTFEELGRQFDEGIVQGEKWAQEKLNEAEEFITEIPENVEEEISVQIGKAVEFAEKVAQTKEDAKKWAEEKLNEAEEFITEIPEKVEEEISVQIGKAEETYDDAVKWKDEQVAKAEEAYNDAVKWKDEQVAKAEEAYNDAVKWKDEQVAKAEQAYNDAVKWKDEQVAKAEQAYNDAVKWKDEQVAKAEQAFNDAVALKDEKIAQAEQLAKDADKAVRQAGRNAKESVKEAFADAKVKVPEKKDRTQALESSDKRTRQKAKGDEIIDSAKREMAEAWNEKVDEAENLASKAYNAAKATYNWVTGWFK